MASPHEIESFLSERVVALAGASRSGSGYGCAVLRQLADYGYEVLPIHPQARQIEGVRCYESLRALPKQVGGLVLVVPPEQTQILVDEAAALGIKKIWMQPGAESPAAVQACSEQGILVIHGGDCILAQSRPLNR